ncbi:MAG: hypothetical protein LBQ87_02320 [Candidatus Fibromonas sp.]|nr:hypothetical protein [Candidatus Fibromonas sp.]
MNKSKFLLNILLFLLVGGIGIQIFTSCSDEGNGGTDAETPEWALGVWYSPAATASPRYKAFDIKPTAIIVYKPFGDGTGSIVVREDYTKNIVSVSGDSETVYFEGGIEVKKGESDNDIEVKALGTSSWKTFYR